MKRKYAAMILGLTMTMAFTNAAYASAAETAAVSESTDETTESTDSSIETEEDKVVYGEITELSEDSVTINVGTMKTMEKPEGGAPDGDTPDGKNPGGFGGAAQIELTGESQTISITESTTYEKETMPEMPEGDAPDGETPDGEAKEDAADSADEKSEDQSSEETEDTTDEAAADESADSDTADDQKADGEKPEGKNPADGTGFTMPTETITADDVQVGDTVKVTLDEDGNAVSIVVMNSQTPEDSENTDEDAETEDSAEADTEETTEE